MRVLNERSGEPAPQGPPIPSASRAPKALSDAPSASEDRTRGTLTKREITQAVYSARPGLSRRQAKELVEAVLEEIVSTLVAGEDVSLHGFGKFAVRQKRERPGRNPKTGVAAPVTARRVVAFKASGILKTELDEE